MSLRSLPEALGQSEAFLRFQEELSGVAQAGKAGRPVLIIGERGTGKELAAARLHYLSARWQGPMVALNCAALAPTLLDTELFGHEAGAFTGAGQRRKGRFELADSGTLFLDEIAQLSLPAQEKILRAVEYGEFERVGGVGPVRVDVRVVGATNADLPSLAESGRFKRDLLDRLSFAVLTLPPLREREGDVELLARHFAARMSVELEYAEPPYFADRAMDMLLEYAWPGNVRELKNVVERAVLAAGESGEIREVRFDPFESPWRPVSEAEPKRARPEKAAPKPAHDPADAAPATPDLSVPMKDAALGLELSYLRHALEKARHNQRAAAELLGLTYHQFRGLYRKHADELLHHEDQA